MIILASQSSSRRTMLENADVAFESVPADIDERAIESAMDDAAPEEIAQALAAAKAAAVSSLRPDHWVLGSDSLVVVDGVRFNKPASREEADQHLRHFSGRTMQLYSAAALARDGRVDWVDVANARLDVRELSAAFIESYLDREWPQIAGCAGAFRIEARGPQLFERIMGDQFTVLGMPLLAVLSALRARGELLA